MTTPIEPAAIETSAKHSYEYEGDRRFIKYVGWDNENEATKEEWRESIRQSVNAYLAALAQTSPAEVVVPDEPLFWNGCSYEPRRSTPTQAEAREADAAVKIPDDIEVQAATDGKQVVTMAQEGEWQHRQALSTLKPEGEQISGEALWRDALEAIDAEYLIQGQCKELLDAALAVPPSEQISGEAVERGWQDISTAPKDGTPILLAGAPNGPVIRLGNWGSGRYRGKRRGYEQTWVDLPGHGISPTHWMLLPNPPEPKP